MQLSLAAKTLLQRAAFEKHKAVSEFVIESSLMAAAETLADRQFFFLDEKRWKAFQAALDAPTKSKPRLEALLQSPSVLE
ncbi:MAG: type II toxin-antitoxin system TacA family antitoxin [Leptospirales bacterium]